MGYKDIKRSEYFLLRLVVYNMTLLVPSYLIVYMFALVQIKCISFRSNIILVCRFNRVFFVSAGLFDPCSECSSESSPDSDVEESSTDG